MTLVDDSILLIKKAQEAENNNRLMEAIELYTGAGKLLLESSKVENPEISDHRVKQARSIFQIADNLKEILQNQEEAEEKKRDTLLLTDDMDKHNIPNTAATSTQKLPNDIIEEKFTSGNIRKNACSELIKELLPVLDTLDAGIAHDPRLEPVKAQLMKILQANGLHAIDAKGTKYDPNIEEVVGVLDQREYGTVLEEVQKGYTLNGNVIRASKVIVSKR